MKKFLFAIAAIAMGVTASAQSISAEFDATTNKLTVSLNSDGGEYSAFDIFIKTEGCSVTKVARGKSIASSIVDDNDEALYVPKWSTTSSKEGFGLYAVYSSVPTAIADGTIAVFTLDGPGNITLESDLSTMDSKSVYPEDVILDAVRSVNASEAVSAGPSKYLKNGTVVIKKGNKQYNAAGAELK